MSRHHGAVSSRRWERVRRAVFDRDGYRCTACGAAGALECDHVRPLALGSDPYDQNNLQTLCRSCHIKKTSKENSREITPAERAWNELVAELTGAR